MINFIIGAIFAIVVLILCGYIGYIMDRSEARFIRKKLGEDFEMVIMSKSDIENYKKYNEDEKTVDVRAKDNSFKITLK